MGNLFSLLTPSHSFCSAAVCTEQFSVPCQGTLFCSDVLLPALKAEGETHLFML